MFVQEVCGSWIDHPFWRSSFKLSTDKQLAQLQHGAAKEVIIDTRKGLDVKRPEVEALPAADPPPPAPPASGWIFSAPPVRPPLAAAAPSWHPAAWPSSISTTRR